MLRKAFVMSVNEGCEAEYERRHQPIWAELEQALLDHGVQSYTIFLHPDTRQLFAYAEIRDQAQWDAIASTDICQRWWAHMKELMPRNPDNSPLSTDLREVFHMQVPQDAQPQEPAMNSRQAVRDALNHRDGDRVAIDFGSTGVTGMHASCVAQLRDYYALEKRPVKICEPYQMLGELEDDLLDVMGIDTVGMAPAGTLFGFPNENWKPFTAPWGQQLLVSEHFHTSCDGEDLLIHPQGDPQAPPSGRMPAGGFFFDTIIRQEPLDEENLRVEDNLEEFHAITTQELKHYRDEAARLAASPRAVVGGVGGTGFGDIAHVPAPFLKHPKGIRDIEQWYMAIAMQPDYLHAIFERQCAIALENLAAAHAALGETLDVLFICGTDFGTQTSRFCSLETFDELYAPYYRQINAWVHANTNWKTFKHSCGAVEPLIPHFIDCGFDILNPVQCSATGMDPATLKQRYGDHIVFWGGGVDTQKTLPFGTPQEVRREVLERCAIFAPGGGFVFNTIHNVQALTPVANIVAMINAVREFNGDKSS